MSEFLAMGGHGFFVWGSYLVCAIVVIAEVLAVRSRRRAAIEAAQAATPEPQPPAALGAASRAP
jgi:heme exporter protein D